MFNADQEMFLTMYSDMRTAKASMLQDLEKGKPTEVRMINGYVCQTGDKYGIETPFNDKVVEIVTKIERASCPVHGQREPLRPQALRLRALPRVSPAGFSALS